MSEQQFSYAEIAAILKSCREHRVARLKIGTFSVSFLPRKPKAKAAATPTPEEQVKARRFESEAFLENEKRVKMETLAHLRIADPEKYEELLSQGELEDAGQEPDRTDP
jgi:hypothetical protein